VRDLPFGAPWACRLLADALGTGDCEFTGGLLKQLADVSRSGKVATKQELDFILSVVHGINPKDETEALLAAQMAAIHKATMVAAIRLAHVETIPQQGSASTMLNKPVRTFAAQVEALKKYRSAGEQTIKVQHVTVNDGGQVWTRHSSAVRITYFCLSSCTSKRGFHG